MVQPQKTPIRCDQCVKYLPTKSDLRKHLRQHTGEKPFLCTECNKYFSQLSHLRRHERVHTGEKRFKCNQCGKSFTQGEGLKLHTRIHTGEKPFTCEQCGKSFIQAFNLQRHQKQHPNLPKRVEKKSTFSVTNENKTQTGKAAPPSLPRERTGPKCFKTTNETRRIISADNSQATEPPKIENVAKPMKLNSESNENAIELIYEGFFEPTSTQNKVIPLALPNIVRHRGITRGTSIAFQKLDSTQLQGQALSHSAGNVPIISDIIPNKVSATIPLTQRSPNKESESKLLNRHSENNKIAIELVQGGIFEPILQKRVPRTLHINSGFFRRARRISIGASLTTRNFGGTQSGGRVMPNSEGNIDQNTHHRVSVEHFAAKASSLKTKEATHKGKLIFCKTCEKPITKGQSLKKHEIFCKNERHFKCSQCKKEFFTQAHLNRHQMIHTGEKPYGCQKCSKSFSQRVSLLDHERTHTGERPHLCIECGRSFTAYANLKAHQQLHSGKSLKCKQCGKQFARGGALKKHEKSHFEGK